MESVLLIVVVALSAVIARLLWRVLGELLRLGVLVRRIQGSLSDRRAAMPDRGDAEGSRSRAGRPESGGTAGDEGEPVTARRRGGRGQAVVLPNGQRRVDYIRDRYYRDRASRSAIRAEINAMLAEAGAGGPIRHQVVYGATSEPTDPRANDGPPPDAASAVG